MTTVAAEWGRTLDPAAVEQAIADAGQVKLLAVVHVETSTGVVQPLPAACGGGPSPRRAVPGGRRDFAGRRRSPSGRVGHRRLLQRDAEVRRRAARPVADHPQPRAPWKSCRVAVRPCRASTWTCCNLQRYWITDRTYHHTASMPLIYALREALIMAMEEGLDNRQRRHERNATALKAGLAEFGMRPLAAEGTQAPPLTAALVPDGLDEAKVRRALLNEYGIEIGGGFGPLAGRIWRIGLMGESSQASHVLTLLHALETLLPREGVELAAGAAVDAAQQVTGGGVGARSLPIPIPAQAGIHGAGRRGGPPLRQPPTITVIAAQAAIQGRGRG